MVHEIIEEMIKPPEEQRSGPTYVQASSPSSLTIAWKSKSYSIHLPNLSCKTKTTLAANGSSNRHATSLPGQKWVVDMFHASRLCPRLSRCVDIKANAKGPSNDCLKAHHACHSFCCSTVWQSEVIYTVTTFVWMSCASPDMSLQENAISKTRS